MLNETIRLLIVDDDDVDRERTRRMLQKTEFALSINEAFCCDSALEALATNKYDCIITDYRLGSRDGLALLEIIKNRLKLQCAVIMLTGLGNEEIAAKAFRLGVSDYIQKRVVQPIQLLSSITGAVHRISLERKIHDLAHYDPLTKLINRTFFIDRLQQRIEQTARDDSIAALCFLDLDNFKPVNDTFGHEAGDAVLQVVAKRLSRTLRVTDSVSRLGGDEFVVLLTNLKSSQCAMSLIRKLQENIAKPIRLPALSHQMVSVTSSIGVTMITDCDLDADGLLRHADQSMYLAKRNGGNQVCIFDSAEELASSQRRELLLAARNAVTNDEFLLHYQPKVDMRDKTVLGVEALIRWNHPKEGLIYPDAFTDALEDITIGSLIGEWVIVNVLKQMTEWQKMGLQTTVSLNIAAPHFQNNNFSERLFTLLNEYKEINPANLELEILETVSISDMQSTITTLNNCREIGVKIALDDFGTGYSSLNYLKNLPLDTVKIDRSFIFDIIENKGDIAIVKSIVTLSKTLGYNVIAEGVETLEHENILLESECYMGQGYSIARPMSADLLNQWMHDYASGNESHAILAK